MLYCKVSSCQTIAQECACEQPAHECVGENKNKQTNKQTKNSPKFQVYDAKRQEHVETPFSEWFVHDRPHFLRGHALGQVVALPFPNPLGRTYTGFSPRRRTAAPSKSSAVWNPWSTGTGKMSRAEYQVDRDSEINVERRPDLKGERVLEGSASCSPQLISYSHSLHLGTRGGENCYTCI